MSDDADRVRGMVYVDGTSIEAGEVVGVAAMLP